jgi:hypothetical protein
VFLQAGGAVSWGSKKQSTVSSSTTEAEYVAAGLGVREARWFQKLGGDLEGWGEQGKKEVGWVVQQQAPFSFIVTAPVPSACSTTT